MPDYARFRNHPFVQQLAGIQKWTVSTNKKMPLDMRILVNEQRISGALYNNENSLMSLDELYAVLPNAANYAFYLDALTDNFIVLDIEPKCPQDIKDKLFRLPAIYRETSMSGHGLHLVFPLPVDILNKYEDARQKVVFKESHGWYEILLNHYVTFTANILPEPSTVDSEAEFLSFFESMAADQKIISKADVQIEELESVNTEHADLILRTLLSEAQQNYKKTPADFSGDHSRYEFAYTGFVYRNLEAILKRHQVLTNHHDYTDSEKAWLIWQTTSKLLPYRPKHDEVRCGLPWLLYLAREIIASNKADQQKKK